MAHNIMVLMVILAALTDTQAQSGAIVTRARLLFTHAMPSMTQNFMKRRNHWPEFLGQTFRADLVNNYQVSEDQIQQIRLRQQQIVPDQQLQVQRQQLQEDLQPQLQQQMQQDQQNEIQPNPFLLNEIQVDTNNLQSSVDINRALPQSNRIQQQQLQPNPFLLKEIQLNKNNLQALIDTDRALSQQVQPIQSSLNFNLQQNAQNIQQHEQNGLILNQPQNSEISPEIQQLSSPFQDQEENQVGVFSDSKQLETHNEQQSSFNEDPVIKQLSSEIELLDQQLLELSQQSPQQVQGLQTEQTTPFVPVPNFDQFLNSNTQTDQHLNQLFEQQHNLDQFQDSTFQSNQQPSQLFDQQQHLDQFQNLNIQSNQQSNQFIDQQQNLDQFQDTTIQVNQQPSQLFNQEQNLDQFQNLNIQAQEQPILLFDQQQSVNQFDNLNAQSNQQSIQFIDQQQNKDQFENLNIQPIQQSNQLFDQTQNLNQFQNLNTQMQQSNQLFNQQQNLDQFQNPNIQISQKSGQLFDQQPNFNRFRNLNTQTNQQSSILFDQQQNIDQFQNLNIHADQQPSQLFDQQQNIDQFKNLNIQADQQPSQPLDQQQNIDQLQNLIIQADQLTNQLVDQQQNINQLRNSQLFEKHNLNSQSHQQSIASFDQPLSPTPATANFNANLQQFASQFDSTSSSLNEQSRQQFNSQFAQQSPQFIQQFTGSGGFNPQHISQVSPPISDANIQQQQVDLSTNPLNVNQQQFEQEFNNQFNGISQKVPQQIPSNEIHSADVLPQTEQFDHESLVKVSHQQQLLQPRPLTEEVQSQQLQLQQPQQHQTDTICRRPCQKILDVVCGSDGVSYTNPCELGNSKCSNKDLIQLNKGLCGTAPTSQRRRGKSLASAPAKGNEVPPGILAVFAAAGPRTQKGFQ